MRKCDQRRAQLEDQFLEAALNQLRNDADARAQALQHLQDYVVNNKSRVAGRFLSSQAVSIGLGFASGSRLGNGVGTALAATAIIGSIRSEIENGGRSLEDMIRAGAGGDVRLPMTDPLCGCQ